MQRSCPQSFRKNAGANSRLSRKMILVMSFCGHSRNYKGKDQKIMDITSMRKGPIGLELSGNIDFYDYAIRLILRII
jgi:hypothetical protein